jgi:hypothetical protein
LSDNEGDDNGSENDGADDKVTVTVTGRVPVYLNIFSESELILTGESVMRRSTEICGVPCNNDLEGIVIVATGFYRGQLRGSYTGSATKITIPLTVQDPDAGEKIVVTSIGWESASDAIFSGRDLESVTFAVGNEFTRIHARAFMDNKLSELTLPDSLKRIDIRAFARNSLTELIIPEGVHTIEWQAFAENDITEITIGDGVTIGDQVFGYYKPDAFREAYEGQNGGAGTYSFDDSSNKWVKEE